MTQGWFSPPGKPQHRYNASVLSVVWSGGTLCKLSLCASKQTKGEGLRKMCWAVCVYRGSGNESVLNLCLFNQHVSSRRAERCRVIDSDSDERRARKRSCLHTLDESQLPFSEHKAPSSSLCFGLCRQGEDVRPLPGIIYQWRAAVSRQQSAVISVDLRGLGEAQRSWCLLLPPTL